MGDSGDIAIQEKRRVCFIDEKYADVFVAWTNKKLYCMNSAS